MLIFSSSLSLALLMLAFAIVIPYGRLRVPVRYCAEWEVVTSLLFAGLSLLMATRGPLGSVRTLFQLPLSDNRIAVACIVAALALFTIHGGTYVVRGLLTKSGTVPMARSGEGGIESNVDVKEYNRGRLIGALERTLLFAVVIAGSYEAIGFIVAAKGLVRSREFEQNRDMTEYFLIGSLSSVLVALATGFLAHYAITAYW
ncbi:MAG: hypothetical protein ABI779_19340 [Acidobacteriota bacterium]